MKSPGWPLIAALAVLWPGAAAAQNTMVLLVSRVDDYSRSDEQFRVELELMLEDTSVTAVTLTVDGQAMPMVEDGDDSGQWEREGFFEDLAEVQSSLQGEWRIDIEGPSPSTTTFILNASDFVEADFYATASDLSPANAETRVAPDVTFSWVDPTGSEEPYVLIVYADDDRKDQEVTSLDGGIGLTDTSWQPVEPIAAGSPELSVSYIDTGESFVGPLSEQGIMWSLHPAAPDGYDPDKPLLGIGSETTVQFNVPVVEDFEAYALQTDVMGTEIVDQLGPRTVYLVTDAMDPVASVGDWSAVSAGIADTPTGQVWTLGSGAGSSSPPDPPGRLVLGEIPASLGAPGARVGPFADFFWFPVNLDGSLFRATLREATGGAPTDFRFVAFSFGDMVASPRMPLSTDFQSFVVESRDFFGPGQPNPLRNFGVTRIGLQFFTDQPTVPALSFEVDELELEPNVAYVPEPAGAAGTLAVLAALAVLLSLPTPPVIPRPAVGTSWYPCILGPREGRDRS